MCGIAGVITDRRDAQQDLIAALSRLEYRGYDSAGLTTIDPTTGFDIQKSVGPVAALANELHEQPATIGIAHTRWATHGAPSIVNAHPHLSEDKTIAVVHNGTVRNLSTLRAIIADHGIRARSDTDSEVIAHLIGVRLRDEHTLSLPQCNPPSTR